MKTTLELLANDDGWHRPFLLIWKGNDARENVIAERKYSCRVEAHRRQRTTQWRGI